MSTPTNQGTMFLVRYACVLAALILSCASARKNATRRLSEAARRLSPLLNPNPMRRRLPEQCKRCGMDCKQCGYTRPDVTMVTCPECQSTDWVPKGKVRSRRKSSKTNKHWLKDCPACVCERCSGKGKIRKGKKGKKRIITCPTCDGTGLPPPPQEASAQDLDFVKCGECSDTGEMQYNGTTRCLQAGRMNKVMRLAHFPFCPTGDCTIIAASTGAIVLPNGRLPCTHCAVKVSVPGCEDMSGVYIRKSVSDPECAPEEWRRCRSKFFYLNEKSGWCVRQISTRYWNICTRWTNAYISKAPSGEVPTKNSRKQGWEACDHLCDCGMRVRPSYQRNAAGYPVPRWPARCKNPECGRLHEGWITLKPRFPEPTVELINDFDHPKLFKKEPTLP